MATATERVKRYRDRKRHGILAVVSVEFGADRPEKRRAAPRRVPPAPTAPLMIRLPPGARELPDIGP